MTNPISLSESFPERYMTEPNSGCWLWTWSVDGKGYGLIRHKGTLLKAHRVSWKLHKGEVPKGAHVLHKCDTPCCVNPGHLFLGTNQDNVDDKVRKGRQAHKNKTRCPQGHLYSGKNLYVRPSGYRSCRECSRIRLRRRYNERGY